MHQHYQLSNLIEILLNFLLLLTLEAIWEKEEKILLEFLPNVRTILPIFSSFLRFRIHSTEWNSADANVGPIPYLQAREVLKDLARCFTNRSNPWHIDKPNTNFQRDLNLIIEADRETQKQQPKGQKSSDPDRHLQDDRWQDKRKKTVSRMQSRAARSRHIPHIGERLMDRQRDGSGNSHVGERWVKDKASLD